MKTSRIGMSETYESFEIRSVTITKDLQHNMKTFRPIIVGVKHKGRQM